MFLTGKVYDLGGQYLAANSAPVVFHLAKEMGSNLEEMDSHKLVLIDSSTGKYQDLSYSVGNPFMQYWIFFFFRHILDSVLKMLSKV